MSLDPAERTFHRNDSIGNKGDPWGTADLFNTKYINYLWRLWNYRPKYAPKCNVRYCLFLRSSCSWLLQSQLAIWVIMGHVFHLKLKILVHQKNMLVQFSSLFSMYVAYIYEKELCHLLQSNVRNRNSISMAEISYSDIWIVCTCSNVHIGPYK